MSIAHDAAETPNTVVTPHLRFVTSVRSARSRSLPRSREEEPKRDAPETTRAVGTAEERRLVMREPV